MNKSLERAAIAAFIVFGSVRANAQITTVVAPPPQRNQTSAQAVAQREQATQDSVARVTLTDMREWVDSAAAALAIRPDTASTPTDTTTAPAPGNRSAEPPVRSQPDSQPTFRDGARAPNTATPIPTLAVAGAVLIALGVAMRRRPALVARPPQRDR